LSNVGPRKLSTKVPFQASSWMNNKIDVIRTGTPLSGQIGPHSLPLDCFYTTEVYNNTVTTTEKTEVEMIHNRSTGIISLIKAARSPEYDGVVFIRAFQV